ncbi:MAG TPA: tRNA dihydrouridine synthase DusB [Candidatus Enterenecus stercoripullorum]|nr:tRNA dihydrouridine synthase DusB [Candidatus Enterenecus stercoripullorum]
MKIGNVEIPSPIVLGPMAGVTDLAFRTVCRELSECYTVTEMVSTKALCYGDKKTPTLLQLGPKEHPAGVQVFGSDEECMERGAALALEKSGADILDVNMGCPVPKVVNSGDGSALMRDPDKAVRVIKAVIRGAAGVPVTVKFRLGWDKGSINCVDFARRLEEAGVAAVAVHGRTRAQMYSGTANWDYIREVKQAVSIPVIANGDVFEAKDAVRILRYTGADMVMVGRGAFGNPWLLAQCAAAVAGKEIPPLPPLSERVEVAVRQFELALEQKGEKIACLEMRKHYAWYLRGVPYASYWKEQVCRMETAQDFYEVTKGILRDLC